MKKLLLALLLIAAFPVAAQQTCTCATAPGCNFLADIASPTSTPVSCTLRRTAGVLGTTAVATGAVTGPSACTPAGSLVTTPVYCNMGQYTLPVGAVSDLSVVVNYANGSSAAVFFPTFNVVTVPPTFSPPSNPRVK